MESLFLSIITINYNDFEGLDTTVKSVVSQTFDNYEYIIIDGGSNDGSKELIEKYASFLSYWVSERDEGIYDAMNKGISKAKGEWVLFLNSGDCFPNNGTLENIFFNKKLSKYDVLYGNVIVKVNEKTKEVKPSELCSLFYKMPFCHQSSMVKLDLLKTNNFSLKYQIASDYNLFCKLYSENCKFKKIKESFAVFSDGGVSSTNKKLMHEEFEKISLEHFKGFFRTKMYLCYRLHVLKRKITIFYK